MFQMKEGSMSKRVILEYPQIQYNKRIFGGYQTKGKSGTSEETTFNETPRTRKRPWYIGIDKGGQVSIQAVVGLPLQEGMNFQINSVVKECLSIQQIGGEVCGLVDKSSPNVWTCLGSNP